MQLELGGKTSGRAPKGITPESAEAKVDAYLSNPEFYPVGTFDETQDGMGNPVVNTPLFRQDLAAPYGTAGEFAILDNIGNSSYTSNLDPTTLVTPEGRAFLKNQSRAARRGVHSNSWSLYSGSKATNGGSIVVTNTIVSSNVFYRLAF
ncbi:MAG: hypothetical protein ACR2H1_12215 [Limisphaerales bacterium]